MAVRSSTWTSWFNDRAWIQAINELKRSSSHQLGTGLAQQLIRAWGDETTNVSPDYLVHCYRAAGAATGTILDFGAGVNTLLMAWACRGRPASVLAVDHDQDRRRRVIAAMARLSRRSGDVRLGTLEQGWDLAWPVIDFQTIRRPIAFVTCHRVDGLGHPQEAWRQIVQPRLPDDCPVYFDPP
jgi:hypothetical protein